MVTLLQREFTVGVPLQRAWEHLALVEGWPSWALHIKKIELQPPGELGPRSMGVIHLTNGMKSAFRMTEFNPPDDWKWVGPILWGTVHYDHRFEALDGEHTRLTFIVKAEGFGVSVFGRLFARIYRRSLDKAIPRLIEEMEQEGKCDLRLQI
jgi:hypothetical protein